MFVLEITMQKITSDPSFDIFRASAQPLHAIFSPRSVALIGASDKKDSVGRTLLWNLLKNPFGGTIYPINPKHPSVLGVRSYGSIFDVPEPVDLAIIATRADTVPAIVRDCVAAGVKGAIIISAGFKEIGEAGIKLEREIQAIAKGKMRIIGPNCLGLMNPRTGLNATFAGAMAQPGSVGFISQSGAFCTSVLDWSKRENVGFSAFVSIGSMIDVDWGDLIYYLGDDPYTRSIVIYMESIGNARSFISAAREVGLTKPIIVIKAGRSPAAAQAAASHTGSLAGSDAVLDAAFRRCGVLRVQEIHELFHLAEVLSKSPRLPKGPNLTIITNAGGPGVLATDALMLGGGHLTPIQEDQLQRLNAVLPPSWSHHNPVDILGDADPERYEKAIEVLKEDPHCDGLLIILTPQAMTDPSETARRLSRILETTKKPVIASWMGSSEVEPGHAILNRAQIPTHRYPDSAAKIFNHLWRYQYNLQGLYETPSLPEKSQDDSAGHHFTQKLIKKLYDCDRTLMTEAESKDILAAYDIPTVKTQVALTEAEAVELAETLGFPVVLKVFSKTLTHKTDVGGVELNIDHPRGVERAFQKIRDNVTKIAGAEHFGGVTVQPMVNTNDAYELILGSSVDEQFGPILLFGTGGQLVEVFKDQAIALPPLNTTLAQRLVEQTKIYKALQGVRGRKAVNMGALLDLLVNFSQLVIENPQIKELDINPLLVSSDNIFALDARVILHDPHIPAGELPKAAIRPYPRQYSHEWFNPKLQRSVLIRPIRPEDEPHLAEFHQNVSEESVYLRYFHLIKLSTLNAHPRLSRLCFIDYDRDMTLVAEGQSPDECPGQIMAIARLSKCHGVNEAEFAMLVADPYQHQGLGAELLRRLLVFARDEGIDRVKAEILPQNRAMRRVCEKLNFTITPGDEVMKAELWLREKPPTMAAHGYTDNS